MVNRSATRGYSAPGQPYHRARPGYPVVAIEKLLDVLHLGPGDHVVELGAGTGIFSQELLNNHLRVTAVEPVEAMRQQIRSHDWMEIVPASAEDTGLPDLVADGVVAATAWHWFDAPRALAEVRRLLRPGKGLGLIWNSYDESVPWVAALAAIADSRRPSSSPSDRSGRWRTAFEDLPDWTPLRAARFDNPVRTTKTGVTERVLSSSAVAALAQAERDGVRDEIAEVFATHRMSDEGPIVLPYVTAVYWTYPR